MTGLSGARRKVARAAELAVEAQSLLDALVEDPVWRVLVVAHPEEIRMSVLAEVFAIPDERLDMRVSEAFTALREALDYTAWEVFRQGGGDYLTKGAKRIQFPIVDDPSRWPSEVSTRLPNATPAVVECIRSFQPAFRDAEGRTFLTALQSLTNPGKHADLHTVGLGSSRSATTAVTFPEWMTDDQSYSLLLGTEHFPLNPGRYLLATIGMIEGEKSRFPLQYVQGDWHLVQNFEVGVELHIRTEEGVTTPTSSLPIAVHNVEHLIDAIELALE